MFAKRIQVAAKIANAKYPVQMLQVRRWMIANSMVHREDQLLASAIR
jgi:hypothetical protein